ncbi:helix-turn-helix domain-containing protein [Roseibium algae]|uniref:Helix-turn-helix domain-containing protein n=1 Tax=Roseibium algae TaxID=3123038 RepID=A0ABU8TK69_9HYPH
MDEIEGSILAGIPPQALNLSLTRSTIRMQHSSSWHIDKTNKVDDLVICLEGEGRYLIGDKDVSLLPGDAMFIPSGVRFRGWNPSPSPYTGIAQHFSLTIFNQHDLMAQMDLNEKVHLSRWPVLEPLVSYYRNSSPATSTTLTQHHLFMFLLISYIDDAFVAWRRHDEGLLGTSDALALSIMLAATQISADPLNAHVADTVVEAAPYNPDYFQREFRKRIGWTPRKFQEFKRMERAMSFLESGRTVSESATEVGYQDVYYFSRMFKRHIGTSPRGYVESVRLSRDGAFPRGEEDGLVQYPILPAAAKANQGSSPDQAADESFGKKGHSSTEPSVI